MIYLTNLLTALPGHGVVLGSLISLQTLQEVLNTIGYPAVALFVFLESAGVPLPGETMVLLASFTAAVDHQLQIPIIIACAAMGAIMGDNLGYLIGRTGGRAFVERFGKYFFLKPHHLAGAEQLFSKHGEKTVFFGRFFALLRIWAAFLAGMNRMRWPVFLLYNAAGGIVWATLAGTIGYLAGNLLHLSFGQLDQAAATFAWIAIGILAALVLALIIWRWRRKDQASQRRVTVKLEAVPAMSEE
jgi:membrane protein DedA with SNARE-associated domain